MNHRNIRHFVLVSAKAVVFVLALCLSARGYAQKFTEFKFAAGDVGLPVDLVGDINENARTISFTTQQWIEGIDRLRATFAIDGDYEVRVGGNVQESGVTENDFRRDVVYTAGSATYTVVFKSPQASGLPVIKIDTQGGTPIADRENYVPFAFRLTDPNDSGNDLERDNMSDGIRGRGNSTWDGNQEVGGGLWIPDKKPYRIKFDDKVSLFGLPAAKSWVLLANWFDPTLMKNTFAFELGDRLGLPYNHSYHHVELYLNGSYCGSYMFTEHTQVGEGRVDIDEDNGWLAELDFHYDEEPKFRTDNYELPVMVKSPETEPLDMSNADYVRVKADLDALCDLMAASDFPENGYRDLIDVETMVKYFMIATVTGVGDFTNPGSVYFYRDAGGKIGGGPSWDFDINFGFSWLNTPVYEITNDDVAQNLFPGSTANPQRKFFLRFSDDPVFMAKWREIWNNYYSEIESMTQFIDDMAAKIRKSAMENYKISWVAGSNNYPVDFDRWTDELKNYFVQRLEFLNEEYKIDVPANLTATYGQTLANVALPAGWEWMDATAAVGDLGKQTHKAKFGDVRNLNVPVTVRDASQTVGILLYHGLTEGNPATIYEKRRDRFYEDMEYVRDNFDVVSLSDIEAIKAGNKTLTRSAVAITFDDCTESDYSIAMPVLEEFGFKATFFVITDRPGEDGFMTWEQINDLAHRQNADDEYMFAIGSHSCSHQYPGLQDLTDEQLRHELGDSKAAIEGHTGLPCDFFALPYGIRNGDATVINLAEQLGYKMIRTSRQDNVDVAGGDLFDLPSLPLYDFTPADYIGAFSQNPTEVVITHFDPVQDVYSKYSLEAGSFEIPITGITGQGAAGNANVSIEAEADNFDLIESIWVDYTPPQSDAVIRVTTKAGGYGRAKVNVRINETDSYSSSGYFYVNVAEPDITDLPVVHINTGGAEIADRENYVSIQSFKITDPNNPANSDSWANPDDGMRGRGNDSWENPNAIKKSYRVKFDEKHPLLGMTSSKSWILHAQYRDPTLMFNPVAFEFGRRIGMPCNHTAQYVELYLNGEYRGNYMLTEHNQTGEGRVDIDEDEGWFVEMDGQYDEDPKFRTNKYRLPVMVKTPETEPLDMTNPDYIRVSEDLNALTDAVASDEFPNNGYRELIDMETFVNFMMVTEIVDNMDFRWPGSTYVYKDKDSPISMGWLWDFDCGYGYDYAYGHFNEPNKRRVVTDPEFNAFFKRFYEDPVFLVKYKERWNEKYPEITAINEYINATAGRIEVSAEKNFNTWWYRNISQWWIQQHGAEENDFHQQVENLKNYLNVHVAYLNTELNKVEMLPKSKSFGMQASGSEFTPQIFTLVAYGDVTNLTATLQKGNASGFEVEEPVITATGKGGYLVTVNVKPKAGISAGTHDDMVILQGTNQGAPFTAEANVEVEIQEAVKTSLPIVYINTGGAEIADRENYVSIQSFKIIDPANPANNDSWANPDDGMRGRGNDSWENPNAIKKSYRVKFDEKHPLLGMTSSKSWILHAQFRDPTLLFNPVAFELGRLLEMPYNHTTHFVELYLNGEYRGNYMLTEHNQTGEGRVDIDEDEGWFVEIDGQFDEEPKFRTRGYSLPVMIKTPEVEPLDINNTAYDFVVQDLNRLTTLVESDRFPNNGYRDMIDMDSFIDFMMVNEIVDNKDFQWPGSTYAYKDKGGAISMGWLWDFDCGYGYDYAYEHFNDPTSDALMPDFFARFLEDPVFLARYQERWKQHYPAISTINKYIDVTAAKIEVSAELNFNTWWYRNISQWWIQRHGAEENDFHQQVENLKNYLNARIAHLNDKYNNMEVTAANELPKSPSVKVWAANGLLHITGLTAGWPLNVYTATGALIYRSIATSDRAEIPVHTPGIYIVQAGSQTVKAAYRN